MNSLCTRIYCSTTLLFLTACGETAQAHPTERPETASVPSATVDVEMPKDFKVLEVYVFVPAWEGAEGFSAGGKYVIQGTGFHKEDRQRWTDGESFILLPTDGSPAAEFEIVAGSLQQDNVEVRAIEHGGLTFGIDSAIGLIPQPPTPGLRLVTTMAATDRPDGESQHEMAFGIDTNGDNRPEYVEFNHHCKQETAPYPMDEAARNAWNAEHGEIDWDYTCKNIYTRRDGKWTKGERKMPA